MNDERYLTTYEVADHYRTSPSTVRYWRYSDYGPKAVKVGKRLLYPRENVEAFDRKLREQNTAGAV
jgi:hypothetical protein